MSCYDHVRRCTAADTDIANKRDVYPSLRRESSKDSREINELSRRLVRCIATELKYKAFAKK